MLGERKRVMVVEDDRDTRDILSDLFTLLGHEPIPVESGAAAIAACLEHHPDVVFLDVNLPDMTGHDVATRLRAQPSAAPPLLIALTGRSQPADIARSFAAGMDLHIVKPVGLHVLTSIVGDAIRGHRPTRFPQGSGRWTPAQLGLDR